MKKILSVFLLCMIIPLLTSNAKRKPSNLQVYDFDGFDSLCIADSIPRNLNTWESTDYYDEKDGKVKTKFYISIGDSVSYLVWYNDDGDFVVEKNKLTE